MSSYYWVYLPDIDEAGTVVEADSFEAAFNTGCAVLYPDEGVEVQVHELGESQTFTAGDVVEPEAEPDGDEYIKTREFLLDLAERNEAGEVTDFGQEITTFLDNNGSMICLTIAARHHREKPAVAKILDAIKIALLAGN